MLCNEFINCMLSLLGSALIVAIISWKVAEIIGRYVRQRSVVSPDGRAVIITGCDTGFGNGLAFELNRLGFYTIALCLDVNSPGVQQLIKKSVFRDRLVTIELDITCEKQIDTTFTEISNLLQVNSLKLWVLVNNAGVFHIGFVEWGHGISAYQRALAVNTLGTIQVTKKYLPLLRQSGGRVVNVLSVAARLAIDGYSPYCVSKHGLLAFNDSLRREMFKFGVKVISVEPSCYRTPMAQIDAVTKMLDKYWSQTSSSVCDDYGVECFENFKKSYTKQVGRARDPQEVIDALKRAVICHKPEIRYRCCGLLAGLIWSAAELLPIEMFDTLWQTIYKFEVFSK